ncbi:tetratricopeptide repeat protein [Streptomyces sp. 110]|uniref:Tetratricopeptide repeat protein n=1 Tax=Streptomyces endocoffeicus TaxID=2898945 RepID=A0ABS1PXF7_9ACTN|nr:AfsR/SARP family transcriptional regulator [Streptomyces endocoffeicus]MBL1117117.1 tetratricopeptide repeat protein [Streptomyces endocoffeicus]
MEFRVLGPVEAAADGRPVDLGHPKQRAVAAVLLCELGRPLPAEQLIDRVWGEHPPGSVRNVLYGYIGGLRTALRSGGAEDVRLGRRSGGYLLEADPERVDLHRFQRLVTGVRAARHDGADVVAPLRDALALWRGDALTGMAGAWAEGTRVRLAEERLAARLELYDAELCLGRHREVLAWLRAMTDEQPLDERAVRQLMTALYRCERQAEALDAYEATRSRLAEELGVDPGPELRSLHERILRNDPALGAPAPRTPPDRTARASAATTAAVSAAAAAERAGPAAPAPGPPPQPAGLPHVVGGFRGRAEELARLDALLPPEATLGTDPGGERGGLEAYGQGDTRANESAYANGHSRETGNPRGHGEARENKSAHRHEDAPGHSDARGDGHARENGTPRGHDDARDNQSAHRPNDAPGHSNAHANGHANGHAQEGGNPRRRGDAGEHREPAGALTISALFGTAGVGKTALAVHWAHRNRHHFPDGQLYVDLRGFDHDCEPLRPAEAVGQLLHGLGVPRERIPADRDEQVHHYRSLLNGRRMLVVLDNAASAEQVRPLLPGSPSCHVVVTSRQRLTGLVARDGARPLVLGSLAPAEAHDVLAAAVGENRLGAEPEAAARLSELCGALPLALRVAAAQLVCDPGLGVADLAAELDDGDRLGALELDGDPASAVRRAFTLSYRALAPGPRRLFRLLGLAPGPEVTVPAAAALLGSSEQEARVLLRALDAAHLVESPRPGRYRPHDLLREYAAERALAEIPEPERAAALDRLLDFYLDHAGAATAFGYTPLIRVARDRPARDLFDGRDAALAWLESERANLVAAVVRAAETDRHRTAWRLADELRGWLYQRRHLPEWETTAQAGLRAARRAADPLGAAAMRHGLATLYRQTGEVRTSLEHHQAALAGYRRAGFAEGEAGMLMNLAALYDDLGDMRRASEWLGRGITLLRTLDRPELLGPALTNSAAVDVQFGNLRRAVDGATEAIEAGERRATPSATVAPLINRGLARRHLGELDRALADGTEAVRVCEELSQRHHESTAHDLLALVHRDAGRYDLALDHAEHALAVALETGTRKDEADGLTTLGEIHRLTGRVERAEARFTEALDTSGSCGLRRPEADAHLGLARVRHGAHAYDAAADHARHALGIARDHGLRLVECRTHHTLATLYRRLGCPERAGRHTADARRLHAETGYRPAAAAWPAY